MTTELEQSPGRRLIGGGVSYEHGDCSVAASALNASVGKLMLSSPDKIITVPLIESPDETLHQPVRMVNVPGLNKLSSSETLLTLEGINPVKLAFIERLPAQRPARKRLTFIPKLKRKPDKIPAQPALPQLAALFENGFLLPLLSFKKTEEDGVCSWVQVGNEASDDSVHSTGDDDRTPSLALVEAVRHIIDDYPHAGENAQLRMLVEAQMAKNKVQVSRFFELRLASLLHEFFTKDKIRYRGSEVLLSSHKLLALTGAEGEGERIAQVSCSDLIPACILEDGSRTSLSIVHSPARNEFEICAITRGDVAVTLATIDLEKGTLQQAQPNQESSFEKDRFIQSLLILLRNGIPKNSSTRDGEDQEIINSVLKETYGQTPPASTVEALKLHMTDSQLYPDGTLPEWLKINARCSSVKTMQKVVEARKALNDEIAGILTGLGVSEALEKLRGETSPHYEYMLHRFNALIGSKSRITLEGKMIGTATGSTVVDHDIRVELQRNNGCYEIKIYSRADSMVEKPLLCHLQKIFDASKPMPQNHEAEAINDVLDSLLV